MSTPSPADLWRQAEGDRARYRDLLREHGYLIPGKPEPLPCGWPGPKVEVPEHRVAREPTAEERRAIAHLREQTLARKAKANRGQGDLVDEMPSQWRDG